MRGWRCVYCLRPMREVQQSYIILSGAGVQHHGQVAFTTGLSITACQFSEQWTAHALVSLSVCYGACVCVYALVSLCLCVRIGCKQVNNNNHKSTPVPIPRGQVLKTVNKGLGKKDYSSSANSPVLNQHSPPGKDHKTKKRRRKKQTYRKIKGIFILSHSNASNVFDHIRQAISWLNDWG